MSLGRNRKKIDDRDYAKVGLCRVHHTEIHTIGLESFCNKYKIEYLERKK